MCLNSAILYKAPRNIWLLSSQMSFGLLAKISPRLSLTVSHWTSVSLVVVEEQEDPTKDQDCEDNEKAGENVVD